MPSRWLPWPVKRKAVRPTTGVPRTAGAAHPSTASVTVEATTPGELPRWDHKARRVKDERTEVPF